jgi:phospho-N-acetylmuramoyl-pentapeptide-transferase
LLYWLYPSFSLLSPFRIFRYLTFRTAFASLTAFYRAYHRLISSSTGCEFQIGQFLRGEGPKAHQRGWYAHHGRLADCDFDRHPNIIMG